LNYRSETRYDGNANKADNDHFDNLRSHTGGKVKLGNTDKL